MTQYFDPLAYENPASIARALDEQPIVSLPKLQRFDGAGIYALYYTGGFSAYAPPVKRNLEEPGSYHLYRQS